MRLWRVWKVRKKNKNNTQHKRKIEASRVHYRQAVAVGVARRSGCLHQSFVHPIPVSTTHTMSRAHAKKAFSQTVVSGVTVRESNTKAHPYIAGRDSSASDLSWGLVELYGYMPIATTICSQRITAAKSMKPSFLRMNASVAATFCSSAFSDNRGGRVAWIA